MLFVICLIAKTKSMGRGGRIAPGILTAARPTREAVFGGGRMNQPGERIPQVAAMGWITKNRQSPMTIP